MTIYGTLSGGQCLDRTHSNRPAPVTTLAKSFEDEFRRARGLVARKPQDQYRNRADETQKIVSAAVRGAALVSRCAAEISPEKIQWLWPSRLARGKHTCIAGEPGTGKSQLSIAMIAIVTTGGEWPCAEGQAPLGSVIILSAEDGAADTIVPRLMAASADL